MLKMNYKKILMFILSASLSIVMMVLLDLSTAYAEDIADKLTVNIFNSNGGSVSKMTDASYGSNTAFSANDTVSITCDSKMYGIYIKWDSVPDEWSLEYDGKTVKCGTKGFLHEYIEIPEGTLSLVMKFSSSERICDLSAYSKGQLPDDVQKWDEPLEQADILVFPTHADDEILFMGGVLVTYAGEQDLDVQVAYMCEFNTTTKIREHEKLDGIWHCGIRNYPLCGNFKDLYSETLEQAQSQYNMQELLAFVTECIRKLKPQVVVGHDLKGEYGHGGHIIYSTAVSEVVLKSMDASYFPESAAMYGTWDVPKTYLHLYENNVIDMDLRAPLKNFDNKNSIDVQTEAYKLHVSQQWCWFYVSDTYEYSCARFGLYRTTVGNDTGNDMMENLISYKQQKLQAEIEASKQAESEAESLKAAEEESIAMEKKEESSKKNKDTVLLIVVLIVVLLLLVAIFVAYRQLRAIQERKRRARRRARQRKVAEIKKRNEE